MLNYLAVLTVGVVVKVQTFVLYVGHIFSNITVVTILHMCFYVQLTYILLKFPKVVGRVGGNECMCLLACLCVCVRVCMRARAH